MKNPITAMVKNGVVLTINGLNAFFVYVGGLVVLLSQTLRWIIMAKFRPWQVLEQMRRIGVASFSDRFSYFIIYRYGSSFTKCISDAENVGGNVYCDIDSFFCY